MAVTRLPQLLRRKDQPQPIINSHQVILVINAKSITEVPEDLGTILLELEMTGQIFPEKGVFKVKKTKVTILPYIYGGLDSLQSTFLYITLFDSHKTLVRSCKGILFPFYRRGGCGSG